MQIADDRLSAELREALGLQDCPPPPADAPPPAGSPPPTPNADGSPETAGSRDDDGPGRVLKTLPINSWAFGGLEEGMFPGNHAQPELDAVRSPPPPPPPHPVRLSRRAVAASAAGPVRCGAVARSLWPSSGRGCRSSSAAVAEMRPHCGEGANSYRNAMLELCVWALGC